MTLSLIVSSLGLTPMRITKTPPSWIWHTGQMHMEVSLLNFHFWGQSRKLAMLFFFNTICVPQTDDMGRPLRVRHDSCSHAQTPRYFLKESWLITVRKVVHFFPFSTEWLMLASAFIWIRRCVYLNL